MLNFEGEWLLGPEVGSFIVDSIVAVASQFIPAPLGGTDWWFSTP